ncbi:hypothetical protein JHK85_009558 [Glycine max]|uniref:Uncharacterized protein n=1 Tax=Glycine max TaxID=3847 RepID=K7KIM7_SOYBN|nr:hypothetical protein JHK85_009558 [Glycine max]KAG5065572.1 hypothetical protein JHK86_009303 [Glycine max]KAH1110218.1 hypothetical protein GYH30_009203 [Glycine max]
MYQPTIKLRYNRSSGGKRTSVFNIHVKGVPGNQPIFFIFFSPLYSLLFFFRCNDFFLSVIVKKFFCSLGTSFLKCYGMIERTTIHLLQLLQIITRLHFITF